MRVTFIKLKSFQGLKPQEPRSNDEWGAASSQMAKLKVACQTFNRDEQIAKEAEVVFAFELENGLRAVVVSDPDQTVPAAAALAVLGGSIHEPKERPGLAHFCEHMLLHGTLQPGYRDANFAEYVKQSGGTHNAMTTVLQTCFAFESVFYITNFNTSYQHQELQAIDAEHSMNTTNDFPATVGYHISCSSAHHFYTSAGTKFASLGSSSS